MTEPELVSELEKESSYRKKEISNLTLGVLALSDSELVASLMQACVVLLYAHLEGFVKNSSRQYLQFLEEQTPDLKGLSGKWLDGRSVVSVARLREIVWCMRMDYRPFKLKEGFVKRMAHQRNIFAHGGQDGDGVQIRKDDIRQMADETSHIIESFKSGLIEMMRSK